MNNRKDDDVPQKAEDSKDLDNLTCTHCGASDGCTHFFFIGNQAICPDCYLSALGLD